jgi:IclR family pca regulon transcriptional regulator
VDQLVGDYLPLLLRTAGDVSADWALWQSRPYSEVRPEQPGGPAAAEPA